MLNGGQSKTRKLVYQEYNVNQFTSKSVKHTKLQELGVYAIKCDNYIYIGESLNIVERWDKHKQDLNNHCHCNKRLQELYDNGKDLRFEILESAPFSKGHTLWFKLFNLVKEEYYIEQYSQGQFCILNTENSLGRLKQIPELSEIYHEFSQLNITCYNDILNTTAENDRRWNKFKSFFYKITS